jgi:hypothetical protein
MQTAFLEERSKKVKWMTHLKHEATTKEISS